MDCFQTGLSTILLWLVYNLLGSWELLTRCGKYFFLLWSLNMVCTQCKMVTAGKDKQRAMESTQRAFLFFPQLHNFKTCCLPSFKVGLLHPNPAPIPTHNSCFCWILADSVSVQFMLFLALLQFYKERFETERLYMSSVVPYKKKLQVTPPKIIVAASNMCL